MKSLKILLVLQQTPPPNTGIAATSREELTTPEAAGKLEDRQSPDGRKVGLYPAEEWTERSDTRRRLSKNDREEGRLGERGR
ncbi:unnamed protein product [Boreogadus saida]